MLVDIPNVGHSDQHNRLIMERIYEAATLVYVLECQPSGDVITQQVS